MAVLCWSCGVLGGVAREVNGVLGVQCVHLSVLSLEPAAVDGQQVPM